MKLKFSLIPGYLNWALNNPALDIRIGLQYIHLLREIIYEIDPGKAKEPCYLQLSASNEVGR